MPSRNIYVGCTRPARKSPKPKATPRYPRRSCKKCARKWPPCSKPQQLPATLVQFEEQIHISLLTSVIPFSPALILECDLRADSNRECGLQFWRKSLVRFQCSV